MPTQNELEALRKSAQQAANMLKTMGNETRLIILCTLLDQELSVGELNEQISVSQSVLSQHLGSLRKANLVTTRRDAQTIYYTVADDKPSRIISVLKDIYCPDLSRKRAQ